MAIFKIDSKRAQQLSLKKDGFGNEFNLRDFFAENLGEILGVRFLEKEYQTTDGRIDTLGIDENNSPVIIEYKWRENEEVLSQGLFYRDWLYSIITGELFSSIPSVSIRPSVVWYSFSKNLTPSISPRFSAKKSRRLNSLPKPSFLRLSC